MGRFDQTLAKLTITGYTDAKLTKRVGQVAAMYNPNTVALNYSANYDKPTFAMRRSTRAELRYLWPGNLNLELMFEGRLSDSTASVDTRLTTLRELCGVLDARSQETRYLKVEWGKFSWHGQKYFVGRMVSLKVDCLLFDRHGAPQRARAALELIEDSREAPMAAQDSKPNQRSVVTVPDLASLALLATGAVLTGLDTADVKNSIDPLKLAKANDLDTLDSAQPGQTLVWPIDNVGAG